MPFSMEKIEVLRLTQVTEYLQAVGEKDRIKVRAAMLAISERRFESVRIKQLRAAIHELIVKQHRFIYFQKESTIYFIRAFRKKTMKTPKLEIDQAEKIYKDIA